MNPRLFATCVAASSLGLFVPTTFGAPFPARDLTFEEQVACRTAIERVNYTHRIGATRPFEEAVPRRAIEQKVRRFFRESAALEREHPGRITAESLERELQRVARETRMPERLRELYAALNDDPLLVQECLVRPALVSRLVRTAAGSDVPSRSPESIHDERPVARVASATVALAPPGGEARSGGPGASTPCLDDVWSNGALGSHPDPRSRATAVWTGTEMIVWGGQVGVTEANSGGRYDPAIDAWRPVSIVGAPSGRTGHSAVWTGTRMIVWGGNASGGALNTGGRYDPVTDTWSAVTTVDAPSPRFTHVAVWTGSVMVVWGGNGGSGPALAPAGSRYDPVTDSWSPVSSIGSPKLLAASAGIWTGNRFVVWGGLIMPGTPDVPYGGLYDPVSDLWSPMSAINEPAHRGFHTAVWSGQEMIVWGGTLSGGSPMFGNGGRYNPATDAWTPVPDAPTAPESRAYHAAVWTGDRMIVWGGRGGPPQFAELPTGGLYDPGTGSWVATGTSAVPLGGGFLSAVWSGSRMLVFGGGTSAGNGEGGLFDPSSNSWTRMTPGFSPRGSAGYPRMAVWTGTEMILYGLHEFGQRYDPVLDLWSFVSAENAPVGLDGHSMVWTGDVVVVWGGRANDSLTGAINTGGRYDPTSDTWEPTTTTGAPAGRLRHSAVWTGTQMIVWGGLDNNTSAAITFKNGGRYDPVHDAWAPMSSAGPALRNHAGVWTGNRMIVWGGFGSLYDPVLDTWSPVATPPLGVGPHGFPNLGFSAAVWTGSRMIVWGGFSERTSTTTDGGGRYDPATNTWQPTSLVGAPTRRTAHTAVWTGSHMIVWGGIQDGFELGDGGRYDPILDRWTPLPLENAPHARQTPLAVWDGAGMMIYDGYFPNVGNWNKGGRYISSQDVDHDGFTACGGDCNDANPAVSPAATEICDGVDQNCNLVVDDAPDTDGDGVGACVDCAEGNVQVWAAPAEVASFGATAGAPATFAWDSLGPQAGSQISYDVITGDFSVAGGFDAGSATCLGSTTVTSFSDARPDPSLAAGYWYLVGGRNVCGRGTLGTPQRDAVGIGLCP